MDKHIGGGGGGGGGGSKHGYITHITAIGGGGGGGGREGGGVRVAKTNQHIDKVKPTKDKPTDKPTALSFKIIQYFSTPSPTTTLSSCITFMSIDDMLISVFKVDLDSLLSSSSFSLSS